MLILACLRWSKFAPCGSLAGDEASGEMSSVQFRLVSSLAELLFQKNHAESSERLSMSTGTPQGREELMALLRSSTRSPRIRPLVEQLEHDHPANLETDSSKLRGVWELRWSSSSQPWLMQGPVVENLQVLDPATNRGMNLLRLHGPLGAVAAISVVAHLEVAGEQRVNVRFERGGWIGPRLGFFRPELMVKVAQSFPAWLDITYLDDWLRICRGNAGTVFALVRRLDLSPEQLLPGG